MIGILAAIGTAVATGLAGGAAKKAGGAAAGWVLEEIFGDPDEEQVQAIEQLGDQLTSVQNAVAALGEELSRDMDLIQKELKEIKLEQLYIAWQTVDNDLQQYITQLDVQYGRFLGYAASPKTTTKEEVTELIDEILNTNNGAAVVMAQINKLLIGSESAKGALQLYSEMVQPLVRDGKQSCYAAIRNYFNYYVTAAYAQQRALYLLVEAFHEDGNDTLAQRQRDGYQAMVKSQEIPFVSVVDTLLHEEMLGGIQLVDGHTLYTYDYVHALQDYSAQGFYDGTYSPTEVRAEAEELLTASLCLAPDHNRLVLWMVYPPLDMGYAQLKGKNFNNVDVQVRDAGNASAPGISASYSNVVIINRSNGEKGPRNYVRDHSFKRMVFEDLPGGSYVMKDENGQNGLDPVASSNEARTAYFQTPKYLTYQMVLNTEAQGAFMDFEVYANNLTRMRALTYSEVGG
ncbi:MAG: hypothetical protein Tsb0032_10750 [Kiloniellaceae bacterium]